MSEVQKKNEKKRVDKTLVTAICLCVGLVLFVIGVIVLPEPMIGAAQLSQSIDYIEDSTDVKVVLNSPKQSGGILADAEHIMDEEASEVFVERLCNILKNVKYSDMEKIDTGIWKTKIVIYNTTDELRVYVDSEGVYLEKNGSLIEYRIPENVRADYDALYTEINERLAG